MIIRKPYAFLIKHFKLIHLIITTLLGIVLYSSSNIYNFINDCIDNADNRFSALKYINNNLFIYIIIAITFMFIIRWLLKYKEKPRSIYLFSILYYLVIMVVLYIVFGYLKRLPDIYIDAKDIRMYRDVMFMIISLQYVITIIMLIRGLGFDIKKFNFSKDFEEMNIDQSDNEEVEVDLFANKDNILMGLRKSKREFGYYLKEYKVILSFILIVLVAILGYKIYSSVGNKNLLYNEGDIVGSNYSFMVNESYYKVINERNYIIIKFNISTFLTNKKFNYGNLKLSINDKSYYPVKSVCYNFNYLGTCYNQQILSSESNSYILTYLVDEYDNDNSYIVYSEDVDVNYKIKLNLVEEN